MFSTTCLHFVFREEYIRDHVILLDFESGIFSSYFGFMDSSVSLCFAAVVWYRQLNIRVDTLHKVKESYAQILVQYLHPLSTSIRFFRQRLDLVTERPDEGLTQHIKKEQTQRTYLILTHEPFHSCQCFFIQLCLLIQSGNQLKRLSPFPRESSKRKINKIY